MATAAHLVEVCCCQLPGLGCEVDVVAVVDLGQVVEAVALLGVGQRVAVGAAAAAAAETQSGKEPQVGQVQGS